MAEPQWHLARTKPLEKKGCEGANGGIVANIGSAKARFFCISSLLEPLYFKLE